MFDRTDLKAAQEAGILSREQVQRLDAFLTRRQDPSAADGSENLKFLANFNDTFITIGIVILAIGLTAMTSLIVSPLIAGMASSGQLGLVGPLVLLPVAAVMWALAEYFCGKRKLLLPSMALASIFVLYTGLSIGSFASGISGVNPETVQSFFDAWSTIGSAGISSFLGMAGAAMAVYMRFRLPFSLLLVALAIAGVAYTFTGFFGSTGYIISGIAFFVVGIATLAAAIYFDTRDPDRVTSSSDNAFWLHVAAAPQLIWGLRSMIVGSAFSMPNQVEAALIVLVLFGIGLLSLALNRRALIVSGLITFAMALGRLVEATGGGATTNVVVTLLLLGTGIILLGGGWHTARRLVLSFVPTGGIMGRIFPPEPA